MEEVTAFDGTKSQMLPSSESYVNTLQLLDSGGRPQNHDNNNIFMLLYSLFYDMHIILYTKSISL